MQSVAVVILAAGSSSRLGEPKQLLAYQGKTLIEHVVEAALNSQCRPVVIVVGAYRELVADKVSHLPVHIVSNDDWNSGISSSLRLGVQSVLESDGSTDGVVIALADQPFISAALIDTLCDRFELSPDNIVASHYADTFGVPALFPRHLFDSLLALQGDAGAKSVIKAHRSMTQSVEFAEGAIDIDTMDNYRSLVK